MNYVRRFASLAIAALTLACATSSVPRWDDITTQPGAGSAIPPERLPKLIGMTGMEALGTLPSYSSADL